MAGFIASAIRGGIEGGASKALSVAAESAVARSMLGTNESLTSIAKDSSLFKNAGDSSGEVVETGANAKDAASSFARSFYYSAKSDIFRADSLVSRLRSSEVGSDDAISNVSRDDILRPFYNKEVFQSRIANAFSRSDSGAQQSRIVDAVFSRNAFSRSDSGVQQGRVANAVSRSNVFSRGSGEVKSLDGYVTSRGLREGDLEELSSPEAALKQRAESFAKWFESQKGFSTETDDVNSLASRPLETDIEEVGDISKVVDAKAPKISPDSLYDSAAKGVEPKAANYDALNTRPIRDADEDSVRSENLGVADADSDTSSIASGVSDVRPKSVFDVVDAAPNTLKKDLKAVENSNAVPDNRSWLEKFQSGSGGLMLNLAMMLGPTIGESVVGKEQYDQQMKFQEDQIRVQTLQQNQQSLVEGVNALKFA